MIRIYTLLVLLLLKSALWHGLSWWVVLMPLWIVPVGWFLVCFAFLFCFSVILVMSEQENSYVEFDSDQKAG